MSATGNGHRDVAGPARHRTITIVGTGIAGLRTAEQLRRGGFHGTLILLGCEQHLPYDRPPLSKQVLRGEHDGTWLCSEAKLKELDLDLRPGSPARALDITRRLIGTDCGDVAYDMLVIATGAAPYAVASINGLTLRTLDDAHLLRGRLASADRIVIVGAGLIGCEVAASARMLGVEVDLVDVLPGPMIRVIGPVLAEHVARLHSDHGVHIHMPASAARDAAGRLLIDGEPVATDLVLEAVGVRPVTDWLVGSGLELDNGVVCDENGVAADGVYAVGDVASWAGKRHEHWTSATTQATRVAATLLGRLPPPPEVPYWWSDQYDCKIQGLGQPAAEDILDLVTCGPKRRIVGVFSRAGLITGAVGFSAAPMLMPLRSDIAAGDAVGPILDRLRG
jgi:3-phenylpropionate/trans-cinnamate dioxygenase ferredoxin reductase subunit